MTAGEYEFHRQLGELENDLLKPELTDQERSRLMRVNFYLRSEAHKARALETAMRLVKQGLQELDAISKPTADFMCGLEEFPSHTSKVLERWYLVPETYGKEHHVTHILDTEEALVFEYPIPYDGRSSLVVEYKGKQFSVVPPVGTQQGQRLEFNPDTLLLKNLLVMWSADVQYWTVHTVLGLAVLYSRFDTAVISVAIIAAIFWNLGQSTSEYSAYSIFNKGCRYLLGEARPEETDKQLRGGHEGPTYTNDSSSSPYEGLSVPSKFVNKPCICGSGLKAKKCCMAAISSKKKEQTAFVQGPNDQFEGFMVVDQG